MLNSTQPVFTGTCFTGQPVTKEGYVECPKCRELCNPSVTAYFDLYCEEAKDKYPEGVYVHQECLSQTRKDQIEDEKTVLNWARDHKVVFVNRSYSEYTDQTLSYSQLLNLVKQARNRTY